MTGPRITDHALVRFLDRVGGLDVEMVRSSLSSSLDRAHAAATRIGGGDYVITVDHITYIVRGNAVTTLRSAPRPRDRALLLNHPGKQ